MVTVPDLTIETLQDLIATSSQGVLATIRKDGRPQLSNISYSYDPEARCVTTQAATFRAKTRNLRRDARASVHITSPDFLLWVVAEGIVTLSEPARSYDDPVGKEFIAGIRASNPEISDDELAAHLEAYPIIDRCFIRLHVERIYGGNSSKALGISTTW
jgi:PPOX class probable F420-dependent enzyme